MSSIVTGASPVTDWVYLDFENVLTREISLAKLTLRQYLARAPITALSLAWNDEDTHTFFPPFDPGLIDYLRELAENPAVCFVAHNAAFDIRDLRLGYFMRGGVQVPLSIPQPCWVDCTLEQSMAAWPNQPGGYSLRALGQSLHLERAGRRLLKLDIDLHDGKYTQDELARYCGNDTDMCRALHKLTMGRLDPREVHTGRMANRVRELSFSVDSTRLTQAIESFVAVAASAAGAAIAGLEKFGATGADAYGDVEFDDTANEDVKILKRADGTLAVANRKVKKVRSVKPQTLKKLLLDNLGFDTQTISLKKINPGKLATNADAELVIRESSRANKALSHQRRVSGFAGVPTVDAELGFFRAHTGRYSSPSVGKGLNLHNLPKHDKQIAKPIRQLYRLPDEVVAVRADFANVEYRVEGWLTDCAYVQGLFSNDVLADPYSSFWNAATGQFVTKKDPARQIAKKAVLGLGFLMGVARWIAELLIALSDPQFKVTLADLDAVCKAQKWGPPSDRWVRAAATKLNAPWQVAAVAYHTRIAFHDIHPEFAKFARWLEMVATQLSGSVPGNHQAVIEAAYSLPSAPRRERVGLVLDPELGANTLRVQCGPWSPTVTWRDMGIHDTHFGKQFSSVQAGNKGYRALTKNILIENVTQSAARNGIVKAKHELEKLGWPYILSVHDELLVIVPKDRESVLKAKQDIISTVGPGNSLGFDWAVVVNPDEINVSQSLYEEELGSAWWQRLEGGEDSLLDSLP